MTTEGAGAGARALAAAQDLADLTDCVCGPDAGERYRTRDGWKHDCRFVHEAQAKIESAIKNAVAAALQDARPPHRACPCLHTTPCQPAWGPGCTCVNPLSSSGCERCCSYGSPEQQRAKAEALVTRLTEGGSHGTE